MFCELGGLLQRGKACVVGDRRQFSGIGIKTDIANVNCATQTLIGLCTAYEAVSIEFRTAVIPFFGSWTWN